MWWKRKKVNNKCNFESASSGLLYFLSRLNENNTLILNHDGSGKILFKGHVAFEFDDINERASSWQKTGVSITKI